jgi:hypothetical protein
MRQTYATKSSLARAGSRPRGTRSVKAWQVIPNLRSLLQYREAKQEIPGAVDHPQKKFKKVLAFESLFDKVHIPFLQKATEAFTAKSVT